MSIELIGVIALVLGVIGYFAKPNFIIYGFYGATLLGAAAAIILTDLGGTTIQPSHLLLGFVGVKLLASRDTRLAALGAMSKGSPGFWLLITAVYATIGAYMMPRLFLEQTMAFAVRAQAQGNYAAPLVPTTSNLTQSIYFIGNFVCFVLISGFGSSEAGRKCLGRAALMCVILNLAFAVLDVMTYATNTTELMSFIRNSTYSILSDNDVGGVRRIIGSFVETSSFAYFTLGCFAFATTLWLNGIATRLTVSLSVLSLLALLLSTSTTAYVALPVYLCAQFAVIGFQFTSRPIRPVMLAFLICLPFLLAFLVIGICLNDASYAYVGDVLNNYLFNKMSTASGIERSSWNSQAIQNFFDTFGLGAGNGSVRASSFPIAVIGSLGIPGAITYGLFLFSIWFGKKAPAPPETLAMQAAARSACFAWLIAASASGGFIDLGLPFFAFAALATANVTVARASPLAARTDHSFVKPASVGRA